jgi:alanyl-tRNA synthetase
MTERLYLQDPYLKEWVAKVTGIKKIGGRTFVVLDRTAFHPQGGGQPGDRGTIGGAAVIDTISQEGEILHEMEEIPSSGEVACKMDWEHRFPLMQLHTGEHLLFNCLQSIHPELDVEKVFFGETGKLFVGGAEPSFEDLVEAEERANGIIAAGLPVRSHFFDDADSAKAALPKARLKEDRVSGRIRILEIDGIDWSACSGTHLANTREIAFLKILWVNRQGQTTCIEFGAGEAGIARTRSIASKAVELGLALQVEPEKLVPTVMNLRGQASHLRQTVRNLSRHLLKHSEKIEPEMIGPISVFLADYSGLLDGKDLAELARHLIGRHQSVAVLFGGLEADFFSIVLAASKDLDSRIDMNKVASAVFPLVEGRGGGKADFISGAGRKKEAVPAALEAAKGKLAEIFK